MRKLCAFVVSMTAVTACTPQDRVSVSSTTQAATIDVSFYQGPGLSDAEAIQAAIDAAAAGDTVYFPAGSYQLDEPFSFKSGVAFVGDAASPTVLESSTGIELLHGTADPLTDATIAHLRFRNVRLTIAGNQNYNVQSNVYLKDLTFEDGAGSADWIDQYIDIRYTDGVVIDGCTFLRAGSEHGGRGIGIYRAHNTIITNSYIGTTKDLEAGTPNGYFKTGINVSGYDVANNLRSEEIKVHNTVIRRVDSPSCSYTSCEDHGVYGWGYRGIEITDSFVDGWEPTARGGSVKLRNSEETHVSNTRMLDSGLLVYMYYGTATPQHFKKVALRNNIIDMRLSDQSCSYCGINYLRNVGAAADTDYEDDIYVLDNAFVDGGTMSISHGYGPEFCVQGNTGATLKQTGGTSGVQTSGCVVPASWDRPLAGVLQGDFNGDGTKDLVTRVGAGNGGYWRAYVSNGALFSMENWGNGAYLASTSEDYGVLVGDFDGDGYDDVTYRGHCGSSSTYCWRMHRSTGSGFAAAVGWTTNPYVNSETFVYGFHTGDFNGDGRTDILARGHCGTNQTNCWRMHISTGSDFSVAGWGEDFAPDSVEGPRYGLLIGDYNGDGKDDVAYRGQCAGNPCFRVHLSTGAAFAAGRNWGNDLYEDAPNITRHFGMHVGDKNGDGKADIGYRGRCGASVPQWRYHVSNGSAFSVACSLENQF